MAFETIIYETKGPVALITLNRPKSLNSLNAQILRELAQAAQAAQADDAIGCLVITGGEKAFAAGADIKEIRNKNFQDVYLEDLITKEWEEILRIRKPIIAAVAGYALGGGCEIAMMCDFIIAADTARFGQPEVNLGVLPGAGGTQRLTRFAGKSKAMEMCLTGRMMDAAEAERAGLVSRIVPADKLLEEALKTAEIIAKKSRPVLYMIKECVNRAYETTLREGVLFERRVFHSTFALDDKNEGMAAFVEKREPKFKNR
jgi:enoyl-CoA hydratase